MLASNRPPGGPAARLPCLAKPGRPRSRLDFGWPSGGSRDIAIAVRAGCERCGCEKPLARSVAFYAKFGTPYSSEFGFASSRFPRSGLRVSGFLRPCRRAGAAPGPRRAVGMWEVFLYRSMDVHAPFASLGTNLLVKVKTPFGADDGKADRVKSR
jgi:hypothetical protein